MATKTKLLPGTIGYEARRTPRNIAASVKVIVWADAITMDDLQDDEDKETRLSEAISSLNLWDVVEKAVNEAIVNCPGLAEFHPAAFTVDPE